MAKRVGVVLSGSGVFDGSEIHEAVLTLLALDRLGATVTCIAPSVEQFHVVNHLTGEEMKEKRNVLVESARIARGNVKDISTVHMDEFDAIVLPGGFGAAKNLCNFAIKGPDCEINPDVARLLKEAHASAKPIGAMCIAPAVVARAFMNGAEKMTVTIGNDAGTAAAIEKMGSHHQNCPEGQSIYDREHKLVTTPAYMYDSSISMVARGIDDLVKRVLELA